MLSFYEAYQIDRITRTIKECGGIEIVIGCDEELLDTAMVDYDDNSDIEALCNIVVNTWNSEIKNMGLLVGLKKTNVNYDVYNIIYQG